MRPSSAVRPALPRKTIVGLLATLVTVALLPNAVALADTVTTNFEPPGFTAGQSVNGQGGWKSAVPGDIPSLPFGYDQQVVANNGAPASFGNQSLRLSNAYSIGPENGPPEFHFQTYSKPTMDAAGEDLANSVYTAQFSFISLSSQEQPRLQISVSPDMGEGGRMSFIGLNDTKTDKADGIDVTFYDTNADGDFVPYDLGILPRDKPHTIKFWMKLNPGRNNDLVRISIDGQDYGQCFTTWESFYRATHQDVPISDRLLFLVGNRDGDRLGVLGGGYLFDNVTTTTEGAGLPGCNDTIEKQVDSPTVTAGGIAGYRITVRNHGHATDRNLRVCDHVPSHMTFVSANRKLRRLGSRRCYVIPRLSPGQRSSVHIMLRADSNAPPGNLANIADITPAEPPALPPLAGVPPLSEVPLPPQVKALIRQLPPIKKVKAIVKIIAKHRAATAPSPPPVTG